MKKIIVYLLCFTQACFWGNFGVIFNVHATDILSDGISGTFVIQNDNTSTNTINVTLNLNVTGATQMRFGNTPAERDSATWESYATTKAWTLQAGNGEKHVHLELKNAGTSTSYVADDIILIDDANPIITMSPSITSPSTTTAFTLNYAYNDGDGTQIDTGTGAGVPASNYIVNTNHNIAPLATVTASANTSWGATKPGPAGITNGIISTTGDYNYEYHSDNFPAFIEFNWPISQVAGLLKIYNRTGTTTSSSRLTGGIIRFYDSSNTLVYTHTLGDTSGINEVLVDLTELGEIHDVKKIRLDNPQYINIREIAIFPAEMLTHPSTPSTYSSDGSNNITLHKQTGGSYGVDIASSYIDFASSNLSATNAGYPISGLTPGTYQTRFNIEDYAGNSSEQINTFTVIEAGSPPSIPGTVFYFDAQNVDGDYSDGNEPLTNTPTQTIIDLMGKSHTGYQDTVGESPLYQINTINNHPSFHFDGSDDIIEILDEDDINIDEEYSEKTFGTVFKTSSDITSLQTIYEQGVDYKGYAIQISGGHLYAGVWNTLDWTAGDQYKIIDLGTISANTIYRLVMTHNNTLEVYLNGILVGTQTTAETQKIHGLCRFQTPFGCSLYSTGTTIGLGATHNDTLNLSTQAIIENYKSNFFNGYIGEIAQWNQHFDATQVANLDAYYIDRWDIVNDTDAPIITSFTPGEDAILPGGNHTIALTYNDGAGGGVDAASASVTLQKWNGLLYGLDIASGSITTNSVTSSAASFNTQDLSYGKYKFSFSIDDIYGNTITQERVFYIDEPELIISTGDIDIGTLDYLSNQFSDEVEITVKTVGASFQVLGQTQTVLTNYNSDTIDDWDSADGFGYDGETYTGNITSLQPPTVLASHTASLNSDGEKNTYTYKIKIGALIDQMQAAGEYEGKIKIGIQLDY